MKQEVTEVKWFCDLCERGSSYHSICELCRKEYCSLCEYIGYNPLDISICKVHQEDDLMKKEIEKIGKPFNTLKNKHLNKLNKIMIISNLENDKKNDSNYKK